MASPLNQYAIYDCNILRINLNEMVERRASSQGKELSHQEIDDIAVVLRRKINWEPYLIRSMSICRTIEPKRESVTILT